VSMMTAEKEVTKAVDMQVQRGGEREMVEWEVRIVKNEKKR
jgi:hypothetical protein